jgi:hypothetical protein
LDEYRNRDFADEEIILSSFSYFIEAAILLGSVFAIAADVSESADREIARADISLVSWTLNLPKKKAQLVKADGTVDELLFAAHLMINTYATTV